MDVIVFESEAYYKLQREQMRMFQKAMEEVMSKNTSASDWISEMEAQKILPYKSKKKWSGLRASGAIRFMQVGRKISYSKKSILDFMNRHSLK